MQPKDAFLDQKQVLLAAAYEQAAEMGWTPALFAVSAEQSGVGEVLALELFPRGVRDLLVFSIQEADRIMVEAMESLDQTDMPIRTRVTLAIRKRLEALMPYRSAIRPAVAWMALPANGAINTRSLFRTADEIWYAAGDRSVDFSYYTKRILVSGVYGSVLIFWLRDSSSDCSDTWAFLDRRIADVMTIGGWIHRVRQGGALGQDPFRVAARMQMRCKDFFARIRPTTPR